jgi:phage-related protein (TIGR01555 family)
MPDTNGHTTALSAEALYTMQAALTRLSLAGLLGDSFQGKRNLYELFGWKQQLTYLDFKAAYLRQGIGFAVVNAYPDDAWAQPPQVKEERPKVVAPPPAPVLPAPTVTAPGVAGPQALVMNVGAEDDTPFETAWQALEQRLHLYSVLHRLDILANLGSYAVLLLGLAGQQDWSQPAAPVRGPEGLLYVTPYSEEVATIEQWEDDPNSPQYGQPRLYKLTTGNSTTITSGKQAPPRTLLVHASRVIHVAVQCLDDEYYGIPRLEPIYNNICDLDKLVGGSAEMYFLDAQRRIALMMREGYDFKDQAQAEDTTRKVEEFMHQMRKFLPLKGMDVMDLSGQAVSPKEQFDTQLQVVCAATRIPKRKLTGSERGELSSQQDAEEWKTQVTGYQSHIGDQRMLRPLLENLITLKVLPTPARPYKIQWENLFSLSEEKQAEVAKNVATALAQLTQARLQGFQGMSDERFIQDYLHLDPEDDPWRVELPADGLQPGPGEL